MFLSPTTLKLFPNLAAAACCICFLCLINFWYLLHGLLHNNISSLISHFLLQPFQACLKKKSYLDCGLPLEELHYIWQGVNTHSRPNGLCATEWNGVPPDLIVHLLGVFWSLHVPYRLIRTALFSYYFCMFKDCSNSLSHPSAFIKCFWCSTLLHTKFQSTTWRFVHFWVSVSKRL